MTYQVLVTILPTDAPTPSDAEGRPLPMWTVEGYDWAADDIDNAEWFAEYLAGVGSDYVKGTV